MTSPLVPNLVRGFQTIIVLIRLTKNGFGNGLEEYTYNITRDVSYPRVENRKEAVSLNQTTKLCELLSKHLQ